MADIIKLQAISSLGHASYDTTYVTLVTSIPYGTIAIDIVSTLDAAAMLSLDGGVTDHIAIPAGAVPTSLAPVGQGLIPIYRANHDGDQCYHAGSALKVKDIGTPAAGSIYAIITTRS